jgi:hypothetical protein
MGVPLDKSAEMSHLRFKLPTRRSLLQTVYRQISDSERDSLAEAGLASLLCSLSAVFEAEFLFYI